MDVVTDLTQETISYIVLIQDIYKQNQFYKTVDDSKLKVFVIWDLKIDSAAFGEENLEQIERIREIVFVSDKTPYEQLGPTKLIEYFLATAEKITDWLNQSRIGVQFGDSPLVMGENANKSPSYWRQKIRKELYLLPESRKTLVQILHYVPILVIYVLMKSRDLPKWKIRKKADLKNQRLFQFFHEELPLNDNNLNVDNASAPLCFIANNFTTWYNWWKTPTTASDEQGRLSMRELAMKLIMSDRELANKLRENEVAIPFEVLFPLELEEIETARNVRKNLSGKSVKSGNFDPFVKSKEMKLHGLAFSGGGIRSATFNLGILQKLATEGVLDKFDYLSTVSGGGYIGAWFTSWIKRAGSLDKVEQRLNPDISTDPLAEEVRPIRWLRMYSNYLSPNAGIMSVDAWTVGVTWLRNTLINLSVLLLLFITALGFIKLFFIGWEFLHDQSINRAASNYWLWPVSLIVVALMAGLAGLGMRYFDKSTDSKAAAISANKWHPYVMIGLAFLAAFPLSAWFAGVYLKHDSFMDKFGILFWPVTTAVTLGMLIVALLGKYHYRQKIEIEMLEKAIMATVKSRYDQLRHLKKRRNQIGEIVEDDKSKNELYNHTVKVSAAIFGSSVIAAVAATALLAFTWVLISRLSNVSWQLNEMGVLNKQGITFHLQLILGVPMILETLSIAVIIRMMLMGKLFPDARREWWGRIGAITHRFMFLWILIFTCALIVPYVFEGTWFKKYFNSLPFITGGWTATILAAVNMAFKSGSGADKAKNGLNVKEMFIRFAPYLFLIGFLLIASNLYELINEMVARSINSLLIAIFGPREFPWINGLSATVLVALVTFLLSWRIGINEFSLHHFYRNRLVRAYLGATRRRITRQNTANPLTGFDAEDDFKLSNLTTKHHYKGPYPLINTALNATSVSDLDRQDRKAESFVFSPLYCGYDFSPTRSAAYTRQKAYEYGYRQTEKYASAGGPSLGTAMAISGAAVNPNMGYHSSAPTAFLLTMFNLRLGWWIGNPRTKTWKKSEPASGLSYLIKDVIGKSDINTDYVCLSDGGHFDNMGLYELIRRRCHYILLCDAEEDTKGTCEGLANAIRRCRIDFGVEIDIDLDEILPENSGNFSAAHLHVGKIKYPGTSDIGTIVYVKTSLMASETVDIREYAKTNPAFPQQSTGDQFYDEAQFESYRKLGYRSISSKAEVGLD